MIETDKLENLVPIRIHSREQSKVMEWMRYWWRRRIPVRGNLTNDGYQLTAQLPGENDTLNIDESIHQH